MTTGFMPKVKTKAIPLEPFGGSGEIVVKGMTGGMKLELGEHLAKLARKDNISFSNKMTSDEESLLNSMYNYESIKFIFKRCIVYYPGQVNGEEISEETLGDMSDEMLNVISKTIGDLGKFPLSPTSGENTPKNAPLPITNDN